jgi:hypothetical protein
VLLSSAAYRSASHSSSQTVRPARRASEPLSNISSLDRYFTVPNSNMPDNHDHVTKEGRMSNDQRALAARYETNYYRHAYPNSTNDPHRAPRDIAPYRPPITVQPWKIPQMDMEAVQAGFDYLDTHRLDAGEADARQKFPRAYRQRELQREHEKMNPWQKFAYHMQCKPCWMSTGGCCYVTERTTEDVTGYGHGDGCCAFWRCRDPCCKAGCSHFGDEGCCEGCGCVRCCGLTHGVWNLCDGWFGGWKCLEKKGR